MLFEAVYYNLQVRPYLSTATFWDVIYLNKYSTSHKFKIQRLLIRDPPVSFHNALHENQPCQELATCMLDMHEVHSVILKLQLKTMALTLHNSQHKIVISLQR